MAAGARRRRRDRRRAGEHAITEEAQNCDRLVVLHEGWVAADGDPVRILVVTVSWAEAITALGAAGMSVALHGRDLRVTDADRTAVAAALGGIDATLSDVPAGFAEVFVRLCRPG